MSIAVMSAVWRYAEASGATLLVLLALADYANDSGVCWPGVEALAKKARVSERYVRGILSDLERSGDIIREIGTGPYGVNTYKVLVRDANLAGVRTDTPRGYEN